MIKDGRGYSHPSISEKFLLILSLLKVPVEDHGLGVTELYKSENFHHNSEISLLVGGGVGRHPAMKGSKGMTKN